MKILAMGFFESYKLLYKQRFFSPQPQCCLTFSWIELQILLMCCLIHISIIILSHILYLLYLCLCLDLDLFMSCLCDLFFIFIFIFIMINRIIPQIQTHLFVCFFLEYTLLFLDDNVDEECELISNSKSSASEYCLGFAWFFANFSLVLLIKMFLIKKNV